MKTKYYIMAMLVICALIAATSYAGTIRETPQDLVLVDPLTHHVELISQSYFYGAAPYLEIKFNVVTDAGNFVREHVIRIEGADFTAFTSGFLSTMVSRGDSSIWSFILETYETQAR
jgi:hypothetical protein